MGYVIERVYLWCLLQYRDQLLQILMEQKIYELLEQYQDCKKSVNLPLKIRLFFSTLEQMMGRNSNLSQSKQQMIDASYVNSFQKHSQIQKISFMLKLMQQVSNYFKQTNKSGPSSSSSLPPANLNVINNIQTTCQIQSINFGLSSWSKAKFKLDKFTRKVDIVNKKKAICLNLEQYLVRKSKKHKSTIVFEAASNSVSSDSKKLLVYFSDAIFQQLQREIFQSTAQAHKNHILRWQQTEKQNDKGKIVDKSLVFLNSQQITSFLQYKSLVLDRLSSQNMHFKVIHQKKDNDSNLKVYRSSKVSKIFKIEFKVDKQAQDLKIELTQAYRNKFKFRVQKQIVEQFSKKYHAIYDKYLFSGQVYDQINISEEGSLDKCIFFSKGIENTLTSNMIEFILIQVKQMGMETICTVFTSLGIKNDVPQQLPIMFMLEFFDMIQRGKQEQMMMEKTQQQDFYSIINDQMNDDDFSLQVGKDAIQGYSQRRQYQENLKDIPSMIRSASKFRNVRVIPLDLTPIELENKTLHEYAFLTDWKRIQKRGGLICINPITNSQQKKVIKKVIASIGNNIFKIIRNGANLVNMCLPVSIFKKESHLKTIARNFSYVPLILDKFQHENDQLQRFKSCIAFVISTCNLSISVQKPFNPILGQTYQCWIGGCPLYFEQTSHHPPISTFYFKGRGWTISGCIEPKISANGLNGGKCWSQKLNYIQFQDKSKVCFLLPKMSFNNLIIGDRQFHFIDKFLVYDMKNNYFAEVNFGPTKKGFMSYTNDPEDFIHGTISRTTTAFLAKFKSKSIGIYPTSEDIAKQISKIGGLWTENISFDDKQYMNFIKTKPYSMQDEENPLPSNSTYRMDINHWMNNQLQQAQMNKQKLQVIQRNDRKLRQTYKKKQKPSS